MWRKIRAITQSALDCETTRRPIVLDRDRLCVIILALVKIISRGNTRCTPESGGEQLPNSREETKMKPFALIAASFVALAPIQARAASAAVSTFEFPLTVSPGAKTCLPKAHGHVTDHTFGNVESLDVVVHNLPP